MAATERNMPRTLDTELLNTFTKLSIADEDDKLIESLIDISKKSPKLIKSSVYDAPAEPSIQIRSWKMNEFKYYDIPSPFPTLARGLFTQDITLENTIIHRIVARGYDKFFNIGEVPWTTWESLESHTTSPYTLTLKSNGCIIFIAALTPTKLLVTSKHSLGPIKGTDNESHAQVGERWLRRHLVDAGKTEERLANVLWEKKLTAVAELCDDSFEEHVLPYSKEQTGLHLHGLNECSGRFNTMLPDVVETFAREWGFIVTPAMELKSIPEVKAFTEEIGKTGKWLGQALEGFVVRTHVSEPPSKGNKGPEVSPYSPGSSFFFKVKFDEPYMMYRDWREVTKTLLSKGPEVGNVPKGKMRRPETQVYVKWIIEEIKRDKTQFSEFTKGRGIIATRERFLKWLGEKEGQKELVEQETDSGTTRAQSDKKFGKTIIVPVAIPGVGKTTIAVALAHLFNFGHTQSDDVPGKKPAPVFLNNVVKLLRDHDVVIADKNNHLRQHRQALRDKVKNIVPPVRLIAMNWSFDLPTSTIHRICGDRIIARGDNHQSLQADPTTKSHEDVIRMFLRQFEELLDNEVDESIEMDVEESLEDALARAVDACVRIFGVPKPSTEQMGQALAVARAYGPSTKGTKSAKAEKAKQPRYFALLPEVNLADVLGKYFSKNDTASSGHNFFQGLVRGQRIASRPHVTIVHEKGLPDDQALWDRCKRLSGLHKSPLLIMKLGHVVWNGRIMAVTVSDIAVSNGDEDPDGVGIEFVVNLPAHLKPRLHITVGTLDEQVNPFEARQLVMDWRNGTKGIESCELEEVWVKGGVKGLLS
ncbi:hypothetical protein BDW22DRAFT_1358802 [Trametopsis cervina]|nr:hypothetical protein BDW22DRAFT_1358802 [Trametopsis cervina]